MTIFCHFRTLNYHKKHYKPILLAQEVSADPQGPRTTKNKIYFLRGSEPLWKVSNVIYIEQFLSYRNVIYLKRKLRAYRIQNQAEKV